MIKLLIMLINKKVDIRLIGSEATVWGPYTVVEVHVDTVDGAWAMACVELKGNHTYYVNLDAIAMIEVVDE